MPKQDEKLKVVGDKLQALVEFVFDRSPAIKCTYTGMGILCIIDNSDEEFTSKLVGKEGKTIEAIRRLMFIWGIPREIYINVWTNRRNESTQA